MSSFSMIRRVALAGLLAVGGAGPAMASTDGSGPSSEEETAPTETTPAETAPTEPAAPVIVVPVAVVPSQQAQIEAARARCKESSDRAAYLARIGGPVVKSGEVDRLNAQANACQAAIDAAVLAATTPTAPVNLPEE